MEFARPEIFVFIFLAVGAIALFSFLSVNSFVEQRRKEREAYYKTEIIRRITEAQGAGASSALELLREEDRLQRRRTLEGVQLGGLVTTAVGIAVTIFLAAINHDQRAVSLVGLIPLLVGVALLIYGYRLAARPE